MRVLSYNGITFASINISAGVPTGTTPGPEMTPLTIGRRGYNALHVGTGRGVQVFEISCKTTGGLPYEANLMAALGVVDPYDETERLIVGALNDDTPVQAYGALIGYRWEGLSHDTVILTFSLTDPIWRETTITTHGPSTWLENQPLVLPVANNGKARANLDLKVRPTAMGASPVFSVRHTFTVTNNGDTILRRFPMEAELGSTVGLGTSDEKDTWLFLNGVPQPRKMIGWRETVTYMWFLVDKLGPGETFTYDVAYSAASDAQDLTGSNRIVFNTEWEKRTVTTGGTTTITFAGAGWYTNQWQRGRMDVLSGTGAGQRRTIDSSTATTLVVGTAFSPALDATSVILITMSHNDRWLWNVHQVSRSDLSRGVWYMNRGQTKPSSILFDNPGSWQRLLYRDNRDEKNAARYTAIDVGGGDIDYFALPDMDRTVQGWTKLQESGQADSVAFSSPIKILTWRSRYQFKNPNALCRGIWGARESGAEDWEEYWSDGGKYDTLTNSGTLSFTFTDDIRHLVMHLGPGNEEELEQTWKRDTGSVTSATILTVPLSN